MKSAACADRTTSSASTIPVTLQAFRQSMLDCDIYVRQGCEGGLTLYRRKGQTLESSDLDRLENRGIREVFVSHADQESHRRSMAPEVCRDPTLRPEERYNLLRELSRASFEAAYHSADVSQVVGLIQELGPQLTEVLSDGDLVLPELFSLMSHDDCTYSHSVNVATYTMLLARYLGIEDNEHLCEIATGGLLHDLGKRHIELKVLNKPGKLDEQERRTMSEHPTLGFQDMLPRGELTWEQLMMIYQHHERYDGRGYPVGIPGSEIQDLARITTVADVFHALTSVRPYRTPMSTDKACTFLGDHSGKLFDPDMAQCWISKMKAGLSV
jgi:HD-GYP domain-containing protein (c-di-GMP phosphodiesterase class II)